MSEQPYPKQDPRNNQPNTLFRLPIPSFILAIVLTLEALLLTVIALWLVIELFADHPQSFPTAIALVVVTALAAIGLAALAVAAFKEKSWMRGAALTWQILQLVVAVGAFQGLFSQPQIGWALAIPALVAIVALAFPSGDKATRRGAALEK